MDVEICAVSTGSILDIFAKPLAELVVIVEKLGHDEVKEGPEFCN